MLTANGVDLCFEKDFVMPMQDWQLHLHLLLLLQHNHRPCHLEACRWLGGGFEESRQDRASELSCSPAIGDASEMVKVGQPWQLTRLR